jgi:hypothetical protein
VVPVQCAHMTECNNITFNTDTGITNFKLLKHFSCYSTHVIYKISCTGCGEYYIGQTCYLRNRVTQHKCNIRNDAYRIMKVHTHVHDCTKDLPTTFTIVPFFQVRQKTLIARLTVEEYFRRKFQPSLNG